MCQVPHKTLNWILLKKVIGYNTWTATHSENSTPSETNPCFCSFPSVNLLNLLVYFHLVSVIVSKTRSLENGIPRCWSCSHFSGSLASQLTLHTRMRPTLPGISRSTFWWYTYLASIRYLELKGCMWPLRIDSTSFTEGKIMFGCWKYSLYIKEKKHLRGTGHN
jgi:hypothetical protein